MGGRRGGSRTRHEYEVPHLDIALTLDSGQILRSRRLGDGRHEVASGGRTAVVWQDGPSGDVGGNSVRPLHLECEESTEPYWRRVLSVDDDYGRVWEVLSSLRNPTLDEAMRGYDGMRVLHQDPFEAFATSIVTQNNNVPRIRKCVERMCDGAYAERGRDADGDADSSGAPPLRPFPSAEGLLALLGHDDCGLGYRRPYLVGLCEEWLAGRFDRMVADSVGRVPFSEDELETCERDMEELMGLRGVGPKVASCMCLFGLGHASAVPVDVWIRRLERDYDMPWVPEIAGIQQQYAFEWIRHRG